MQRISQVRLVLAITVLLFAAVVIVAWAAPRPGAGTEQGPWLAHFRGDKVVVTFVTAPPDMSRTTEALLMDAEDAGIVLRFGKEEVFFSFANIMTVEPSR